MVADSEVAAQAQAIAAELAAGPTRAYGGLKWLLYAAANTTLNEQMELETETITNVYNLVLDLTVSKVRSVVRFE